MKAFLKKIGLVKNYSVVIPLDRSDCVKLFRKHIDIDDSNGLLAFKEYFSSSKNRFIGQIDFNGFQIRKRKRFFSFNKNSSIVKGVFRQKGNVLYMNTEIMGMNLLKTALYILFGVFWVYFILFKLIEKNEPLISILPSVLITVLLLFGVPYVILRSRIKRMQTELEQEIYNWILKW